MRVILRPKALQDILDARHWYEQQREGLGEQFVDLVQEACERLADHPKMYAVVLHDIRRLKLPRFPYVAYYRVADDHLAVLAVMHGNRDSQTWQARMP